MLGLDLTFLAAADVGHEPDQSGLAFRPRLERPRSQAAFERRGQHADADLLDDIPDAVDALVGAVVLSHAGLTARDRSGSNDLMVPVHGMIRFACA